MMKMPITNKNGQWYWGSKGPFESKQKAEEVQRAAYASGYEEKAYGEPYHQLKFDQTQNKRIMQAMNKEAATTGTTGDIGGGESYYTPTHGVQGSKKKKTKTNMLAEWMMQGVSKEDLDDDDLVVFTTRDSPEGYPQEEEDKDTLKRRKGIERVAAFMDDFSPKMEKRDTTESYKRKRRRYPQEWMPIASPSKNLDNVPTHSHKTTTPLQYMKKGSLVLDLIEFARVELQKEKRFPTATGAGKETRLMSNDPKQRFDNTSDNSRKGPREGISPSSHTPMAGADSNNVVNMGNSGSLDLTARGLADPQTDFHSSGRVQQIPKKKKSNVNNPSIATVNVPNANPVQIEAMQKEVGHFKTTPPIQHIGDVGVSGHPQTPYTEHSENPDDWVVMRQDDFTDRTKKYIDEERNTGEESGMEPPLTAGAAAAHHMSITAMEKGGGAYDIGSWNGKEDALQRGGDLDTFKEEEHKRMRERRAKRRT